MIALKVLAIVVPCFNEEEVLVGTNSKLTTLLEDLILRERISPNSRVYYVDDGSTDSTWSLIKKFSAEQSSAAGFRLSRNRGHQNALLAGLFHAEGDLLISIDADLQDDLSTIERMLDVHHAGFEIVYGVRDDRTSDSGFKRVTAEGYYRLLSLIGVELVFNHADFRLMSRRTVEALKEFSEVNLFLRGIIPMLGFRSTTVGYSRNERVAGESKYTLRKMLALAWEGVTSMSVVPLRFVTAMGTIIAVLSMLMGLSVLLVRLFTDLAIPGWTSTVLPIYLLGGIQILSIGILGEYLGKIYQEVKRRPRFVIEETVGTGGPKSSSETQ